MFVFVPLGSLAATWQQTLEQNFDIVETFDQLQDWRGVNGYNYNLAYLPKKQDGSNSIWTYSTSDRAPIDNWIGNHGADYTWQGAGKSLTINYYNFVGAPAGYGPSRLGTFFGDGISGKSGYKKIHVFFMFKFRPGFFNLKPGTTDQFAYVGVLKFFDILTGFTAPGQWGNSEEFAISCNTPQVRKEYGINDTIFDIGGGGISTPSMLFFTENSFYATYEASSACWDYTVIPSHGDRRTISALASKYLNNEWVGIEIASDIGTIDGNDGSLEMWLYDQNGQQFAYYITSNYTKIKQFDHYYNKVTLGGNRFGSGYDQDEGDSDENRFYVDDFIIDSSRIGPSYFALLNNQPTPTPTPPSQSADLNTDSRVNSVDFGIMLFYWNSTSRPKADINQDGAVNSVDFGLLMSQWSN